MVKPKKKKTFSQLPAWKKRVAIAKDVIKQLTVKSFVAQEGTYVHLEESDKAASKDLNIYDFVNDQANCAIRKGNITCSVCAKGALFMSHVMKTNHLTVHRANRIGDDRGIARRLEGIFFRNQLNLIEAAFEKATGFYTNSIKKNYLKKRNRSVYDGSYSTIVDNAINIATKAVRFGERSENETKRLIRIMKNIIRNKGEFKP